MKNDNGTAIVGARVGRGNEFRTKEQRARITPKRVSTYSTTWDRAGNRITPYHPAMQFVFLLSYRIDGGDEVVIDRHANLPQTTAA